MKLTANTMTELRDILRVKGCINWENAEVSFRTYNWCEFVDRTGAKISVARQRIEEEL